MTKTSCNSHADHIHYIKQAAKFLENHRPNHRQNPFKSMIIPFKNSFQQYSQCSQMPKMLDISRNNIFWNHTPTPFQKNNYNANNDT